MALRSPSRTATATSGPGRGPASDGRTRHRRPPRAHSRPRRRRASAEELRRRADLLFATRAGERPEPAKGPEPGGTAAGRPAAGHPAGDGREPPDARDRGGSADGAGAQRATAQGGWRERAGPALRERLPVWLQARCGLERRSVAALAVVLVASAVFAAQHFWAGRTQPVRAPEVMRAAAPYGGQGQETGRGGGPGPADLESGVPKPTAGASPPAGAEIVVDVGGKVLKPGIHRLPAGSRVADALRAAGGVRPGTDTDGLNRARLLVDGEQVVVGGPAPVPVPVPGPAPGGAVTAGPAAPLSLNTATADQLEALPGVGPVLARHIVDYRTQHGGFRSVDELRDVNGIGERRFADLRNLVRP